MKWADIITTVDLSDEKVHKIVFSPSLEIEEREGPTGTYWAIMVHENDKPSELIMGKRLRNKIANLALTKTTRLKIQRTGEGFQTDYEVSVA